MGVSTSSRRIWLFSSVLAIALPSFAAIGYANQATSAKKTQAVAQTTHVTHIVHKPLVHSLVTHATVTRKAQAHVRLAAVHSRVGTSRVRYGGISCVPFARNESGIILAGNAWQWWDHADGAYARGQVPEPGSVLAFRSNGRMRLGHVAVVAKIINNREIEIDHANWAGGGIAHGVPVVDVSENNDWTAVRVGLGRTDDFGSVYPTYGFIYDRPDTGSLLTSITVPAAQPALNPPARDLRPVSERTTIAANRVDRHTYDEVAEAPAHPAQSHPTGLTVDRTEPAAR